MQGKWMNGSQEEDVGTKDGEDRGIREGRAEKGIRGRGRRLQRKRDEGGKRGKDGAEEAVEGKDQGEGVEEEY